MRILTTLALIGLAACGAPDNSLEGSISESFSLDFDRVAIYKQDLTLRIEYLKDIGNNTADKVCKIVVDTDGLNLGDETELKGDLFLDRVTIQRVANTGGDFPAVTAGKIHFDAYSFKDGGTIDGNFECVFDNGRTLSGNFDAKVQQVSTQ